MAETDFEKIIPNDAQIKTLYDMLLERKHVISHQKTPSFDAHETFVRSNPYRVWYLVINNGRPVGTFYISEANTVGINIVDQSADGTIEQIITYVLDNYPPLPEIKSVRAATFIVNVSPDNKFLVGALETLGKKILQISYSLE